MAEQRDRDQPRQPRNMQGLLNFCTELTAREDTTTATDIRSLDPERRAFLEEALSSLTLNVTKKLAECVKTLCNEAVTMPEEDVTEQENAIEVIEEYVDDLNHAIDFQKMGGVPVLLRCLDSPHTSLRIGAAGLIGDICQNNLPCQESILSINIVPVLLQMIDTDEETQARVKALYAISCLIRDYPKGEEEFIKANGFSSLMRAMQSGKEKLVVKASFLLSSLVRETESNKGVSMTKESQAVLLSMGYVEQLVTILGSEDSTNITREHCTAALLALAASYNPALAECMRPELSLTSLLTARLQEVKGKEEMQEEESYIKELLELMECDGSDDEGTNR